MGELRSVLNVDLSQVNQRTREVDFKVAQEELRIQRLFQDEKEAHARITAAGARLRQLKSEASAFEAALQAKTGKLAKGLGKGVGTALISQAVAEFGIPEAAQPLVRVGGAAVGGAQAGLGLAGTGLFASVAYVNEVWRTVKAVYERLEKVREKLEAVRERTEKSMQDFELKLLRQKRDFETRIVEARMEATMEFRRQFLVDRRAAALDEN